ncbi:MAG: phospho-N-acetylmuramoyl-pentapeptide-transferase [Bacteroidales bacterium]
MIHLLDSLLPAHFHSGTYLRLLDYLSVRAIAAAMTAILLTLAATPRFIWYIQRRGLVDQCRDTGVPSASDKAGTPVMGGVVLFASVLVSCLLWCQLSNRYLLVLLFAMVWFGGIGLWDDVTKWRARSGNHGISERQKLVLQGLFAAALLGVLATRLSPLPARDAVTLYVPFLKAPLVASAWLYPPVVFAFVMLVGNAVNITDGLDGLAIVPSVFVVGVLGMFAYIMGNAIWAHYLFYPLLPGAGELIVACAAFTGASIGFLWFNAYPAQIFMGDAGSLAIGGTIATLSVLLKQEALFILLGGLFIAEAFTSQFQEKVGVRWLGRRIFARAPLHHSMQHRGLAETKVVVRLWIVAGILALLSIATIKLR